MYKYNLYTGKITLKNGTQITVRQSDNRATVERAIKEREEFFSKMGERYKDSESSIERQIVHSEILWPYPQAARDLYSVRVELDPENQPNRFTKQIAHFFSNEDPDTIICTLRRNFHSFPHDFFWQNGKPYALASRKYTGTTVIDLTSGEIIAEEPDNSFGFCPVGFWVPDIQDDYLLPSVPPGSTHWNEQAIKRYNGQFGFVWGCMWGDDGSWKLEYLDLSKITEGIITRDSRFGYLEIATESYPQGETPPFIYYNSSRDQIEVKTFTRFDCATGTLLKSHGYEISNP